MGTKSEGETRVILRKLGIFAVLFYVVYYLVSIIMVGAFKAGWKELGRFPFRISKSDFDPGRGGPALGAWLAMVITFCLCIALAFYVVAATRKTWDYLATLSLVHFVICCIVNQAFPVNWVWWVTLIIAWALTSLAAEFVIYRIKDLQDIQLNH